MNPLSLKERLPINENSFSTIREKGMVYVDKTEYLYRMACECNRIYYYMARPPKFGKTMLINTLEDLFEGRKELFEGLYIYDKWNWDETYPVFRLNMAEVKGDSPDDWLPAISEQLFRIAKKYDLGERTYEIIERGGASFAMRIMVREIYYKYKKKVVILVDDYDTLMFEHADKRDRDFELTDFLTKLYDAFNDLGEFGRLIFFTGVIEFDFCNCLYGLDLLYGLSLGRGCTGMCGFTKAEIETHFSEYFDVLDRDQFDKMYSGYNWDGDLVYNPYDVLNAFYHEKIKSYWFEACQLKQLFNTTMNRCWFEPPDVASYHGDGTIYGFSLRSGWGHSMLFHLGLLTIVEPVYEGENYVIGYTLRIPNEVVRIWFYRSILDYFLESEELSQQVQKEVADALQVADFQKLFDATYSLIAGAKYLYHELDHPNQPSEMYMTLFYAICSLICDKVVYEESEYRVYLDMSLLFGGMRYVFRLVMRNKGREEYSFDDLESKDYVDKYKKEDVPLYLVHIDFNRPLCKLDTLFYRKEGSEDLVVISSASK